MNARHSLTHSSEEEEPLSISVAIFSKDRNAVVLIKRRDVPVFVLPGGGVEPGESTEMAAIRETREETGLKIKLVRCVGIYLPINRLAKKTFLYEGEILEGSFQSSSESKLVGFFPIKNLPTMPPPYREWIADALTEGPTVEKRLTSVTYSALLKNLILHPILVFRFLLAKMGYPINT